LKQNYHQSLTISNKSQQYGNKYTDGWLQSNLTAFSTI